MTTDAHDILTAARSLPPREQLEVLQGLAQSLAHTLDRAGSPLESTNSEFWRSRTVDELASEQHTPVFSGESDFAWFSMREWPDEETTDDLLQFLHEQRTAP